MANSPVLSDPVLHILLALSDRPRHGYAIATEVEERTDGTVEIGTGTLYTALKRLHRDGLIEEVEVPGEDSGRPKRTYGLTEEGRAALETQSLRLRALVDHALQKSVLPGLGGAA